MSRAPQPIAPDARLLQGQVAALGLLAQLARRARHAATAEELAFLAVNEDFRIAPPEPGELPNFIEPTAQGWVRILPGLLESEGGLDGFFAARLVRTAD